MRNLFLLFMFANFSMTHASDSDSSSDTIRIVVLKTSSDSTEEEDQEQSRDLLPEISLTDQEIIDKAPRAIYPGAYAKKLQYFLEHAEDTFPKDIIYKKLYSAQKYFLCPSFYQNDGYDYFNDLAIKFDFKEDYFNFKKIPLMVATAIYLDKWIFVPVFLGSVTAIVVAFLQSYNNFYDDPNSIQAASCQLCAELWDAKFPHNNSTKFVTIDNIKLYYGQYFNNPACHIPLSEAQGHVDRAIEGVVIANNTEWQNFYALGSVNNSDILYNIIYRSSRPDMVITKLCSPIKNFINKNVVSLVLGGAALCAFALSHIVPACL